MMNLRRCISLLAFLLLLAPAAFAQSATEIPEPMQPRRLVNDFAHVLNAEQASRLEQKSADFYRSTSNEVAIVTVRSIGPYDVADYSVKLFKKWGIGGSTNDNGVLIFAAIDDRKMWITTGKGLEGALTDLVASRIYREQMKPAFRAGDYYKGFDRALSAVEAATKGEYKAKPESGRGTGSGSVILLVILAIVVLMIFRRGGGRGGRGGGGYMSGGGWGGFGGGFLTGSILGGGWGSGGGGGGWGGGGDSGGFGGFGGGDTGGGGAGGDW